MVLLCQTNSGYHLCVGPVVTTLFWCYNRSTKIGRSYSAQPPFGDEAYKLCCSPKPPAMAQQGKYLPGPGTLTMGAMMCIFILQKKEIRVKFEFGDEKRYLHMHKRRPV